MKDLRNDLIEVLKEGSCVPRISEIAKKLRSKSTTIHYNVRQLEKSGVIKSYKAVFDYKRINEGFCTYVLISLDKSEYGNPEDVAASLAKYANIESVDIVTGDWELLIKVRSENIDQYYEFVKKALSIKGITKTQSLSSLKQVKTEFVRL